MTPLLALTILFGELSVISVSAFAPTRLNAPKLKRFSLQSTHLFQSSDDDDEPELLGKLMPGGSRPDEGEDTEDDDWRAVFSDKMKFSEEEMEEIRAQFKDDLDAIVDADLEKINKARQDLAEYAIFSKKRIDDATKLNAQYEKQNLLERIDALTDDFLNSNKDFRDATKRIAAADQMAGTSGRGVDWGSWGTVGGLDVVVGESGDMGRLLGSVDSARRRGEVSSEADSAPVAPENRIMVVCDEQKDKGAKRVMNELSRLLNKAFDSDIKIDFYTPASNIPMGGKNAQTALIFASSLNDRSSLENLLSRVLKRTAPVAGGAAGTPPSHVVIVSSLGTERTNKMPYSMQNMFTGKLDKLREIEQSVVAISRGRSGGGKKPLDYTIVKFGDVANNDGTGSVDSIEIRPGDHLDGEIGPNAAANVLLQAMAYQPYARNSTLCATGNLPTGAAVDTSVWNDKFVCLSGPEILRIEAGPGTKDDDKILDPKFEQLSAYVKEWSTAYEGDRKGTGLTTPVLVRNSRKGPSKFDGVVAREGVRILFQTTNTGDRYKSASEDRAEEKERNSGGTTKKSSGPAKVIGKASKEGGVEVLVEKTKDGELRVRARRCNVDHKTIIKEMSEEVILSSLKKAVKAWVDARSVTGF